LRERLRAAAAWLGIISATLQSAPVATAVGLNLLSQGLWEAGKAIIAEEGAPPQEFGFSVEDQRELERLRESYDKGDLSKDEYELARRRAAPIIVI
jgi:hypothetical protein